MIVKNYLYNLIYQLLIILLPLITIPYVSRVLGAEGIGIYSLTNTYAQYFVFLGMLGLGVYSSREIAFVRDEVEKLRITFWELNVVRFVTTLISIIIYFLVFIVINDSNYKIVYLIQILVLLSAFVDISWLFVGLEDFKKIVFRNIIVKVLGIVLIFLFVKNSTQVWLYALILGGTQLVGQLIMWFSIPKELFPVPKIKKGIIKHLKYSIRLFIPQMAINIYTMLDKIMLGYFTDEVQVGMYDNSQRIIKILVVIVTTLSVVTIPKMANLYKNDKMSEFETNVYKSFSFVSFISFPMTFGLLSIAEIFIPWFFGEEFKNMLPMINIGSFLMITLGWTSILGNQILLSIEREKQFTISVTCGAIINLLLNILLINRYGGLGTTVSSVVAEYTGLLFMLYFLRDIINFKQLFRSVPKYFFSSIVMFAGVKLLSNGMNNTFMTSIYQIVIGGTIYILIMILLRDENLLFGIKFLKNIAKK